MKSTKKNEIHTKLSTRIFVGFMTFLMVASTIGMFVGMILRARNSASNPASNEQQWQFDEKVQAQRDAADALASEWSERYFNDLVGFKGEVRAFNAAAVTSLTTRDLRVGDGAEITADFNEYSMYYIGWLPDETIFDSSIDGDTLKAPLPGSGSYIEGWNEGVIGMRIGGVREISIPSEKAYGEAGKGETIPPNTPLKFIVMAVPLMPDVPFPAGTFDLCVKVFGSQYQGDPAELCRMMGYDNEEE